MAVAAAVPRTPAHEHFRSLELARTQALVRLDMAAALKMHAPEYQLITPAGKSFSRESYLSAIESGSLRYTKWELSDIDVRASQEMAVVRYQARLEFDSGRVVTCWHTDTYELRGEAWIAVWSQATAIP